VRRPRRGARAQGPLPPRRQCRRCQRRSAPIPALRPSPCRTSAPNRPTRIAAAPSGVPRGRTEVASCQWQGTSVRNRATVQPGGVWNFANRATERSIDGRRARPCRQHPRRAASQP
jgi:hypothetical protein